MTTSDKLSSRKQSEVDDRLAHLHEVGSAMLASFGDRLIGDYRMTLVARNAGYPEGSRDLVITEDEGRALVETVLARHPDTAASDQRTGMFLADRLIAISAFRYALGRKTYIPGHVVDWLLTNRSKLTRHDRDLIVREIDEADRLQQLGMDCDVATWSRLRYAFGPASAEPPTRATDAVSEAGTPSALVAAHAAANVNWVGDPQTHIAALHRAHEDLEGAFAARDAEIEQLKAERDDLLRHRAASEAPGWTYQGQYTEGAHLSDAVVAGRVRMLMRTDLDHEAVCCMARDRIRDLSREVARQRSLLGSRLPEGDTLRILVEVGATESACRMVIPNGMTFDEAAKRADAAKDAIAAELAEQDRCPFSTSGKAR